MRRTLFTIGHSTHAWEEFLDLLARHKIESLVDIRRFPGSRKYPQFNQEHLAKALPKNGVEYHWISDLGGRRPRQKTGSASLNLGLRNESFRNYADYMHTPEFLAGMEQLRAIARPQRTAMMCAEGLFWRCHRRLVSDWLTANGATVKHIMPNGKLQPHSLTQGAHIAEGNVTYPGEPSTPESIPPSQLL